MRTSSALRVIERLLARAELEIALISRCRPRNADLEQERLLGCWRRGAPELPRWSYHRVPELGPLRVELARAAAVLGESDPIANLYVERAHELELEARLVEAVGTKHLRALARARFRLGSARDESAARRLARAWSRFAPVAHRTTVSSDDEADPQSLIAAMRREVGRLRLPVKVKASEALTALAATGDRVIVVARGRQLPVTDVARIVLHEVRGHALPRHRASQQGLGLYAVGSRGGNDEQEGYALYLEQQSGLLDGARKQELAFRHRAALLTREGADWVETTRQLLSHGAPLEQAAAIASRVQRAEGLAREIVYLPALCRVRRAIRAEQHVEDWLSSGRLSLDAIGVLRDAGATLR